MKPTPLLTPYLKEGLQLLALQHGCLVAVGASLGLFEVTVHLRTIHTRRQRKVHKKPVCKVIKGAQESLKCVWRSG